MLRSCIDILVNLNPHDSALRQPLADGFLDAFEDGLLTVTYDAKSGQPSTVARYTFSG